jgi:hypothetical protein
MQQSTQHADVIAAALNFGLQLLVQQRPTDQQQQQLQQQGKVLILDVLGAPDYSSPAILLFQLLTWLNSKPDLAADLSQNLGPSAAADSACRKRGLQGMWLAGMQVWQQLLLLTAVIAQSEIGHDQICIRTQLLLVQASAGKLRLGCTMCVVTSVCVWQTCQENRRGCALLLTYTLSHPAFKSSHAAIGNTRYIQPFCNGLRCYV